MICYMPFTHIGDDQLTMLTSALGVLTVCSPADGIVPVHMRKWQTQGLLDIKYPSGVDGNQLLSVIDEYKAWAQIHRGDIGEMAGFFRSRKGFAMMDETNPTQISHQVRHYGDPQGQDSVDPMLQAALFLALAQDFDAHHHAMDGEMDTVQAMEREMMQQISGNARDGDDEIPLPRDVPPSSPDRSHDPNMISRRVQAWARLIQNEGAEAWIYLTPSRAVFEHLLEAFPEGVRVYDQVLVNRADEPVLPPSRMLEILQSMALEPQSPVAEPYPDSDLPVDAGQTRLVIHRISGLAPCDLLASLGAGVAAGAPQNGPGHTLIGLAARE